MLILFDFLLKFSLKTCNLDFLIHLERTQNYLKKIHCAWAAINFLSNFITSTWQCFAVFFTRLFILQEMYPFADQNDCSTLIACQAVYISAFGNDSRILKWNKNIIICPSWGIFAIWKTQKALVMRLTYVKNDHFGYIFIENLISR